MNIESASPADHDAICHLLHAAGLSNEHVRTEDFLVARDGRRVLGCVGMEGVGSVTMLQSLAVHPEVRGRGLGGDLVNTVVQRAAQAGRDRVVALTIDAADFFTRLGFEVIPREALDADVRAFWQFTAHVCATATVLVRASPVDPPAGRAH